MKTALVIGASGGVGGEVAAALLKRGWRVKALNRNPTAAAKRRPDLHHQWVAGDAMRPADVVAAARSTDLIFHGANPPGYQNWPGTVVQMLDATITAARASGARILFPGTVYNYGPDAFPLLREDSLQHPRTRKGQLRVTMEKRLEDATTYGVRSVIVRIGDFFGPRAANNWFSQGLVTPGKPVTRILYPGSLKIGHSWGYLPDVAETMVRVIEADDRLETFDRFHMRGHWFTQGGELVHSIRRVVEREVPVWRLPWFAVGAMSPFVPLFREMYEMRYLWQQPLQLDNSKLQALIGSEPHTPIDEAVRTTLRALSCLAAGRSVVPDAKAPEQKRYA
ncbi:MAG: NAD-dependent epimerase/dehydratase family protein [Alphaproteobacteria bacterium]|nr:NAD-dependent epimerase/dehydratase family protein [Alphaproteobacteria bacterium]MBL6936705.1 NAD-dependent epimerase/dehydratase family protein [Alphaproteobacteria bacterium]MBL7097474.1 NAD-dependent epimerase/dehydratase family protein [Alphaproteobacteria bacterium]